MTEKEKAKAYDEAIERTKKLYSNGIAEEIFPELKESEDEKIRKEIISILRNAYWTSNRNRFNELVAWLEKQKDKDKDKLIQELGEYKVKYTQEVLEKYINNMSNKDDERLRKTAIAFLKDFAEQGYENAVECIDWLEKQGEKEEPQVYETKDGKIITYSETDGYKVVDPNFNEGDWVVNKFGDSWHIDNLDKKNYQVSDGKGNYNYFPISKQDEMHLWTIQDAKDGDVLAASECYVVFKEIDGLNIKCYCTYHYLGLNPSFYRDTLQNKDAFLPATKEQRDTLMKAMNDAGYEWDAGNKELKKGKVK